MGAQSSMESSSEASSTQGDGTIVEGLNSSHPPTLQSIIVSPFFVYFSFKFSSVGWFSRHLVAFTVHNSSFSADSRYALPFRSSAIFDILLKYPPAHTSVCQ